MRLAAPLAVLLAAVPGCGGCARGGHTLDRAAAQRRIVNAHEHIQSAREAPALLAVMDRLGVGRTILMGSSWFTITLKPEAGFSRYDENNAALVEIVKAYPGRFEAWPTVLPEDDRKVEKIAALVAEGASGVKLYIGHGYVNPVSNGYLFHTMAMDDPRMLPLYAWCETNGVPICLHVNPYLPGFAEELIAVLTQFPALKVIAPHFILSSIKESRLRELLDVFPNVWTDVSFGHDNFLAAGLLRISKDPERFRRLIADYPSRFLFGTDLVVTDAKKKTPQWMETRFRAYLDLLSKERYTTRVVPGSTLRGLALPEELLERVLYRNYEEFRAARPAAAAPTRAVDWSRMGVEPTGRAPGTSLPARPQAPRDASE